MCGIAGKISFQGRPIHPSEIEAMIRPIAHRGPDDQGVWTQGSIGLGHRRLSIVDLSARGHQPMTDPETGNAIVFNGEVYNFRAIRKDLEAKNYTFQSDTDTEVILMAYRAYGTDCLRRFRGMFAFAIWDNQKKQLFLARDRLGQKPLKYVINNRQFAFASELKALLQDPEVGVTLSHQAIDDFLTLGYIPAPQTVWNEIHKLPAAHYAIVKDGTISIENYWDIDYTRKTEESEAEIEEHIRQLLKESVELRMISDVPLGAHLSGGIDSASVVAMMSRLSNRPVRTFTIGFEEEAYNEAPLAEAIARHYGADHETFIVKPELTADIPEIVRLFEEPFADVAAIPCYYLSRMTRRHVTVALNGDGGDENFGGYSKYRMALKYRAIAGWPASLRHGIGRGLEQYPHAGPLSQKIHMAGRLLRGDIIDRYLAFRRMIDLREKNDFYQADFLNRVQSDRAHRALREASQKQSFHDPLDAMAYLDFTGYLPDGLMTKTDMATMAFGLEGRSPMLDHHLVEYAATIPGRYKIRAGRGKAIFRSAMAEYLPPHLLNRPKKAFIAPWEKWIKDDLKDFIAARLQNRRAFIFQFLRYEKVQQMLKIHQQGRGRHVFQLFALLMLEEWGRANRFI